VYGNIKYFTMAAQSICLEHHVYGLENESFSQKESILEFLSPSWGNFVYLGLSFVVG
jgi:hypothetical protein